MLHRLALLTLLPLLLSACGDADHPASAKTAPSTAQALPAPVVASAKPVEPMVSKPSEAAVPTKPVAEAKAAVPAKPVVAKVRAKAAEHEGELGKPLAPARLPLAVAKAKLASVPDVHKVLPHTKLDLRLPKEALHGLEPGSSELAEMDKPLLPPLFEEKPKESPFQVGGRLIQREHNERADPNNDSWHSDIRGAELQFKFRN